MSVSKTRLAALSPQSCACGCGLMAAVDPHRGVARTFVAGHNSRVAPQRAGFRHGMYGTPTYQSWVHMLQRTRNPRNHAWPRYGGRGITVCERWLTFENFLADMGERPGGRSIDRIDNDGNYEPANCRWATRSEQQRNKRNNKLGETDVKWIRSGIGGSQRQMAAALGVDQSTVSNVVTGKRWA